MDAILTPFDYFAPAARADMVQFHATGVSVAQRLFFASLAVTFALDKHYSGIGAERRTFLPSQIASSVVLS